RHIHENLGADAGDWTRSRCSGDPDVRRSAYRKRWYLPDVIIPLLYIAFLRSVPDKLPGDRSGWNPWFARGRSALAGRTQLTRIRTATVPLRGRRRWPSNDSARPDQIGSIAPHR